MSDGEKKPKAPRRPTKQRLKNIALYYLERFDSSAKKLAEVLERRVWKYARENPDFGEDGRAEAQGWINEIVEEFKGYGYLDDGRYADVKVKGYLAAGKSARYIKNKMAEKGIAGELVEGAIAADGDYDELEAAARLARKKRLGPFRDCPEEERRGFWQKDMGFLARAGFDYEAAKAALGGEAESEE